MMSKDFSNLTKAQKRIMVARDVLARLNSKKFCVVAEDDEPTFLRIKTGRGFCEPGVFFKNHNGSDQVGKAIGDNSCKVCALGACFVSAAQKFDNLTIEETKTHSSEQDFYQIWTSDIESYLSKIFSQKQIKMIETAYELGAGAYCGESFANCSRSIAFGERFQSNKDRMVAIMNNIINNKGTFRP